MSNSETKLLEPINYTIMHTIYQQFSVLTENSALVPSLLALGLTVNIIVHKSLPSQKVRDLQHQPGHSHCQPDQRRFHKLKIKLFSN